MSYLGGVLGRDWSLHRRIKLSLVCESFNKISWERIELLGRYLNSILWILFCLFVTSPSKTWIVLNCTFTCTSCKYLLRTNNVMLNVACRCESNIQIFLNLWWSYIPINPLYIESIMLKMPLVGQNHLTQSISHSKVLNSSCNFFECYTG